MPAKELVRPCLDCKDAEAVLDTRKRQYCGNCFQRFAAHKVLLRMSKYKQLKKETGQTPKLLLPLSLGVSSSVLLHIINGDIERQLANTFVNLGFELTILVIDPSTILTPDAKYNQAYEAVTKAFPKLTFNRLPFHSVFEYVSDMKEIVQEYAGSSFTDDESLSNEDRLTTFRASISTATSKADLDSVLLTRLVVGYAKSLGCGTVVWGDSDTRLAAKTLAGVAKGRGASLTWSVSDGMSPWGVAFDFPLRDLSKPELEQFKGVCEELSGIVVPDEPISDNVLTKNLSIDELMMRYVRTQGEKYRGVMANVSRTANKLESTTGSDDVLCPLCGGHVGNVKGNSGVTVANQSSDNYSSKFCYGCMRSRPGANC
ncbi:Cytoplasmic tRNA 2-thiolation protein 2 [Penicillium cataractarum]|uniref:Cytoplasmic tRNA 2-thiolation protein 2 n=1 Tax=Penicillium cataractarum TaxID=2100454 RepID=A0A9W9S2B5_9EURO|nr:Cytoplasmic tRNA 2-thiolation protein 2 [Penicillium cataractarum]KAJ5370777.1 Cytoplasmic tRNA 2-thiolation protein 2 [Penicillium cataractarum]